MFMDLFKLPVFMLDKIRTSIFTIDDIELYINGLVSSIECQDFYHGIILDKIRNGTLASYNYNTYKIRIFYEMMKTQGRLDAKYLNRDDYILVTNVLILHSIIHEVVHVFQNYCYHNNDYPFLEIMFRQLQFSEDCDDDIYNYYYSYFTFERDADTIALENILIILRYLIKDAGLFIHYLDILKLRIIRGYQIRNEVFSSPLETIYNDLYKEECPEVHIEDPYTSLKLGLKISKRQYNIFKANYKSIIIEKNNLQI